MICLPSYKIFRPDEADHGIDQQRLEVSSDGIGAGLAGLLVHPWLAAAESAEPWPVSKYMTFSPTVPRRKERAAWFASAAARG